MAVSFQHVRIQSRSTITYIQPGSENIKKEKYLIEKISIRSLEIAGGKERFNHRFSLAYRK